MNISRVKVRRAGAGEDPRRWAAALADPSWLARSRTLKADGDSWVKGASVLGQHVVIKCRSVRRAEGRLKILLRAGRGDRHWRGARWLDSHSFATARPVALATAIVDGVRAELLVMEYIDARSVLQHLAAHDLEVSEEHETCRALARLLTGMLTQGRYNRDAKPSNLLVTERPGGRKEIATIDCVAIRGVGAAGPARLVRMLASLVIEPKGVGVEPRRALKARVIAETVRLLNLNPQDRRRERLELWRRVGELVVQHADPRPRINPLAAS
jgi:hypothetical protein